MDKMTEIHIKRLKDRLTKLDNTRHYHWPQWTYADYCAVSELVRIVDNLRIDDKAREE